jgi:hypothetical protein
MHRYVLYTLIDITDTGNTNPSGNSISHLQSQNLNSIIQALSMRTQLLDIKVDILVKQKIKDYLFDIDVKEATVWKLEFSVETVDVWLHGQDPVGLAMQDLNNVPIELGLDESKKIISPIVQTQIIKNTYIEKQ